MKRGSVPYASARQRCRSATTLSGGACCRAAVRQSTIACVPHSCCAQSALKAAHCYATFRFLALGDLLRVPVVSPAILKHNLRIWRPWGPISQENPVDQHLRIDSTEANTEKPSTTMLGISAHLPGFRHLRAHPAKGTSAADHIMPCPSCLPPCLLLTSQAFVHGSSPVPVSGSTIRFALPQRSLD